MLRKGMPASTSAAHVAFSAQGNMAPSSRMTCITYVKDGVKCHMRTMYTLHHLNGDLNCSSGMHRGSENALHCFTYTLLILVLNLSCNIHMLHQAGNVSIRILLHAMHGQPNATMDAWQEQCHQLPKLITWRTKSIESCMWFEEDFNNCLF